MLLSFQTIGLLKLSLLLAIAFLLALSAATQADSGLARHKKLYVVPVPEGKKIAIDGKLDDWDLSGQIFMYVVSETSEMQSARFAAMYDAEAIYLSGDVRDPSPMMNRHDPDVEPDKAWDADVCQIFMSLDPSLGYPINMSSFNKDETDKACTLLLWHYTDRQEANLVALKAMTFNKPLRPDLNSRGVIPRDKFQGAYHKSDDGHGYTFEYRIPWATLGRPPLKAGDILAGVICVFWSTPDGLKTGGGSAWCYDNMAGPGFPYQSSACWGKIIFSDKGNLPRELVDEGLPPEKPLPLTFTYSLPEEGEASVALVNDKGMVVRTIVAQAPRRSGENIERWDGLDNNGSLLAPGNYTWKGLYHKGLKTKFILSAHNSGQPPYKLDDNTGGWGGDHGNASAACAVGDQVVLGWDYCESGWGIIGVDLNGKKKWGVKHNATDIATDGTRLFVVGDQGYAGAESVKVFDAKDGRPMNWGNNEPALAAPPGGDAEKNHATGVACSADKVYVSWAKRDAVGVYELASGKFIESWAVPSPGRLACRPDGSVAVISQGQVVALKEGKSQPLIAEKIDSPRGITVDKDGTIFVANGGKLQNVSVYDAAGKFQRSIGKEGGRPAVGRYDKNGILEPGQISLDKNGRLWVAETLDGPKRHSVWDTKTGQLFKEFFGASSYFGWAYMDPKHPDELYCHNVLWKVNLDTGSCEPWSTIWRATAPNMIVHPNPAGYAGHFRVMTAKNGKQFGWGMIDYAPTLFMREGDIFKPIAGSIRVDYGAYGSGALYPVMSDKSKYNKPAYIWQDKNNDQTVQEDELIVSTAERGEPVFNWIDSDLNAWCDAGYMFKPASFGPDGRPVYDFSKKEKLPLEGNNANGTSMVVDESDGSFYSLWPGAEVGFGRYTRDGKLMWGYGGVMKWHDALSLPMITPGKLWGLTMPLGVAGDFTGAACYFGPYHIFTRDGLYVGMVMRDGRSGGLGADITASETITGQLVKPEGMSRYFLLAGDQDGRVTEILGLENVKRLAGGSYAYTQADADKARKAQDDYRQALAKRQRLDIVRGKPALAASRGLGKAVDGQRSFNVSAAYDATNLYVHYNVNSPAELVNAITDPQTIFKGGNLLDIQLAADPKAAADRATPAPGDQRLLVTRQNGKTVAVLYRPKVKGFAGQPIVLTSPTGKESFDAIETTEQVKLDYAKTQTGFTATLTIPLDLLGLKLAPGQAVPMELGYIYGNAAGTQASARSYLTNNSFSANVVNDVPNESRLEPKEWGKAIVE